MERIINKVRKGEMVAVEVQHSYTMQAPFRTVRYSRFHVGRVAKATRQGLATLVDLPNGQRVETGTRINDVFVIKDANRQLQAAALFAATPSGFPGYEAWGDLRDAILAQQVSSGEGQDRDSYTDDQDRDSYTVNSD